MTLKGWAALQLITVLLTFAAGVVLGHVWDARVKKQSKNRISRWNSGNGAN